MSTGWVEMNRDHALRMASRFATDALGESRRKRRAAVEMARMYIDLAAVHNETLRMAPDGNN